jgi:hypothetical protein
VIAALLRRRRLDVIVPQPPVDVDRHAEPDLIDPLDRRLLDDPEILWRHMNAWRAAR